ncbi:MAG: hypothetical protein LAO18_14275 [Acidobacteriia bacterium]|nr:hypothetical protein [Terriglobia bacterium]
MRRTIWSKLASTFLLTLMTMPLLAQGSGPGTGMRHYDPKTEVTINGTIEDVQQQTGKGGWKGTHLILKLESASVHVHVGPSSYIEQKQFAFGKGDTIKVVGSKVTISGQEVVLAREITKDGKTVVLRNAQGVPKWSGGRRQYN